MKKMMTKSAMRRAAVSSVTSDQSSGDAAAIKGLGAHSAFRHLQKLLEHSLALVHALKQIGVCRRVNTDTELLGQGDNVRAVLWSHSHQFHCQEVVCWRPMDGEARPRRKNERPPGLGGIQGLAFSLSHNLGIPSDSASN